VLERLISRAPRHLTKTGSLVLVVQRRIDLQRPMTDAFGSAEILARDAHFAIWHARLSK